MKNFLYLILLVFSVVWIPVSHADPIQNYPVSKETNNDFYAVLTCQGPTGNEYLTAYYHVSSNAKYPNSQEIISMNPSRYRALTTRCRALGGTGPMSIYIDSVGYSPNTCRQPKQGCTTTSQCCSGSCDTQLGFCFDFTTLPSEK